MTAFLELAIVLAIIIIGAKLTGYLMYRLNQPMVVGEIGFGVLAGPTVFNLLGQPVFTHAAATGETVQLLGELGVLLLMFLAGMETDLSAMRRVGIPALNSAIMGVVLPFAGGFALGELLGMPLNESVFIGTILTATSVSISAQTLLELRKLRTKEGMTILGAAVIDDVVGILILSVVVAVFASGGAVPPPVWLVGVKMLAFFVIGILAAPLLRRFVSALGKMPLSEPLLAGAVVAALVYSWAAEYLGGVAAITGAYLAGVLLADGEFREKLESKVKVIAYGFFVPIFFVDIGLRANLRDAFEPSLVWIGVAVIVIAIVTKIVGSGLGARVAGFNWFESLRVGTGMVSRGEVGLIVAAIGVDRGVIPQDLFAVMVLMVVVTTLITPVLLRWTFGMGPRSTEDVR